MTERESVTATEGSRWRAGLWRALFVVLFVLGSALPLRAQVSGVRFEIASVGDTTLTFAVGRAKWVHRGLVGLAIDPARHDVLIAQFRILGVTGGVATGVIIGQTTRVTQDHVVLLDEPRPMFIKRMIFWGGLLVGLAIGFVGGRA